MSAAVTLNPDMRRAMEAALTMPAHFAYWGDRPLGETWGYAGLSQHRDSSTIERSNFEVISRDLLERFGDEVEVMSSSHCMVGWMDELIVQVKDADGAPTDAFKAAVEWSEKLEGYSIADDDHLSTLEYEEGMQWMESCLPDELLPSDRLPDDYLGTLYSDLDCVGAEFDSDDVLAAARRRGWTISSAVPCPDAQYHPIEGQMTLTGDPTPVCPRCGGTGFVAPDDEV